MSTDDLPEGWEKAAAEGWGSNIIAGTYAHLKAQAEARGEEFDAKEFVRVFTDRGTPPHGQLTIEELRRRYDDAQSDDEKKLWAERNIIADTMFSARANIATIPDPANYMAVRSSLTSVIEILDRIRWREKW